MGFLAFVANKLIYFEINLYVSGFDMIVIIRVIYHKSAKTWNSFLLANFKFI